MGESSPVSREKDRVMDGISQDTNPQGGMTMPRNMGKGGKSSGEEISSEDYGKETALEGRKVPDYRAMNKTEIEDKRQSQASDDEDESISAPPTQITRMGDNSNINNVSNAKSTARKAKNVNASRFKALDQTRCNMTGVDGNAECDALCLDDDDVKVA